jgi:nickel/cobalt transporter (NicO) family protein
MQSVVTRAGLGFVLALGALWLVGGLDGVSEWLLGAQRAAQEQLAVAIRALRGGEPGALALFWGVCLGYGVLHAVGPGHGKLVIGGYGIARRVPLARLATLAIASSLAQALVAVGLVYLLVALLGQARGAVEGVAGDWVTPFGHAMIAGLGLWLVWRGLTGIRKAAAEAGGQAHHHVGADHSQGHEHGHAHGPGCGHAHGPTIEEAAEVHGFRDGLVLVMGVAMRPCSGALFVLILTWQLGIALAGVIGALVMGLGTALVTVAAAVLAVMAREGAFSALGLGRLGRFLPLAELGVGLVMAAAALGLLWQAL